MDIFRIDSLVEVSRPSDMNRDDYYNAIRNIRMYIDEAMREWFAISDTASIGVILHGSGLYIGGRYMFDRKLLADADWKLTRIIDESAKKSGLITYGGMCFDYIRGGWEMKEGAMQ